MKSTDFLDIEPGKINKTPSFKVPDNLTRQWSPTGLSLEEIKKRKEVLTYFNKLNQQETYSTGIAAGGSFNFIKYTVPTNKVFYITGCAVSAFNTGANADIRIAIYSAAGTEDKVLIYIPLPANVAGTQPNTVCHSRDFSYPVTVYSGQTIRFIENTLTGWYNLSFIGWEEDKDLI